jgi:hypothetical protein
VAQEKKNNMNAKCLNDTIKNKIYEIHDTSELILKFCYNF